MLNTVTLIKEPPRGAWAVCGLQEGPSWLRTSCVCDGHGPSEWEKWWRQMQFPSLPPSSLFSCFSSLFSLCFHWHGKQTHSSALLMPRKGTLHRISKSPQRTQPLGPELGVTGLGGLGATEWDPASPLCDLQGNWRDGIRWRWTSSLEWPQNASLLCWPVTGGGNLG